METKNNLTFILIVWSLMVLFLTSCSMNKLTIEQHQQLNNLDYELSKVWNEYERKSDSLLIEMDRVRKTSNNTIKSIK